jgi:AbrB family looped-hinge helix DNA binding protein
MTNKVGERFQITIDKVVREKLGVQPGDRAVEWIEDGRLVVAFLPPPHQESMLGILKKARGRPIEPITDWGALKERAWEARSREIMESLEADGRRHRHDPDDQAEAPE